MSERCPSCEASCDAGSARCARCGASLDDWFVCVEGRADGPHSRGALAARIARRELTSDTLVWREGMSGWAAARDARLCDAPSAPAAARSESSVLFSLANLTDLARGAAARDDGVSRADGSGLIDIRALARGAEEAAPAPAASEEWLAIGDRLLGAPLAGPVAGPVVAPARGGGSSALPIAIGGAVSLVAIAAAAAVIVVVELAPRRDDAPPAALASESAPVVAGAGLELTAPRDPSAVAPSEERAAPSEDAVASPPARTTENDAPRRVPRAEARPPRRPPREPATSPPVASRERAPLTVAGDDPLSRIFDARPAPAPRPVRELPSTPSRDDVVAAMRALEAPVRACGDGSVRSMQVDFRFASSGALTRADVRGDVAEPVRACVARAARGARVPAFARDSFSVTYPFRL
ncbi:MAG: DUF4339 domain-containing protein [Sandaracinaceae bacterium]|nr:DUF4339 domain-containing protein [Sandaracinaceae bacterium]